jgi:hypothetical protein
VKLEVPPVGMLPESKTPGVSDEDVSVIESLFVQVTVVPPRAGREASTRYSAEELRPPETIPSEKLS